MVSSRAQRSSSGKIAASIFLSLFAIGGVVFCGLLISQARQIWVTYSWRATPAVILNAKILNPPNLSSSYYTVNVSYEYAWEGVTNRSDQLKINAAKYANYSRAQRLADSFRPGQQVTCYVDPQKPSSAILRHEAPMLLFFFPLPLLFIAIGVGGVVFVWKADRRRATASVPAPSQAAEPGAAPPPRRGTQKRPRVIFGLFFLFGAVLFFFITVRPVYETIAARSWAETPCRVVASQVRQQRSKNGYTYTTEILYAYQVNGKEYRANRLRFLTTSSSGYKRKAQFIAQYPAGRQTVCFVKPADPYEAVLLIDFGNEIWIGILPLIFMVIGGLGFFFGKSGGAGSRLKLRTTIRVHSVQR
ncbi:MAG TPA: DUF3592 domain-containing protein [Verrucomicrobiae bacterium]